MHHNESDGIDNRHEAADSADDVHEGSHRTLGNSDCVVKLDLD